LAINPNQIGPHELIFQKTMQQQQYTSFARIGIGNGGVFIEKVGWSWRHKTKKRLTAASRLGYRFRIN
jgi:hypothetical protein